MTFYCSPLRTRLAQCISFWISFLIWIWFYCCCRLYFLIDELLYFPGQSANITLFLIGCLCALNYMSKLDRLIFQTMHCFSSAGSSYHLLLCSCMAPKYGRWCSIVFLQLDWSIKMKKQWKISLIIITEVISLPEAASNFHTVFVFYYCYNPDTK